MDILLSSHVILQHCRLFGFPRHIKMLYFVDANFMVISYALVVEVKVVPSCPTFLYNVCRIWFMWLDSVSIQALVCEMEL